MYLMERDAREAFHYERMAWSALEGELRARTRPRELDRQPQPQRRRVRRYLVGELGLERRLRGLILVGPKLQNTPEDRLTDFGPNAPVESFFESRNGDRERPAYEEARKCVRNPNATEIVVGFRVLFCIGRETDIGVGTRKNGVKNWMFRATL
jgi:hypothetical protein